MQLLGDLCVVSYWIDTLVLKTEGNTYATLLHRPFLFKGKTNASSRGSKNNFWRRCRGDLRQVNTRLDLLSTCQFLVLLPGRSTPSQAYQVPIINSSPSHYIICHSSLVFLSPTSKMILENLCLFFAPFPFVPFRVHVAVFALGCEATYISIIPKIPKKIS